MQAPRIFASAKFQAAWIGTILAGVPLYFTMSDPQVSRADKQVAVEHAVYAVAGLWGISIGGIAVEDYAKFRDAPNSRQPAGPTVQVNTSPEQVTQTVQPLAPTPPTDQPKGK